MRLIDADVLRKCVHDIFTVVNRFDVDDIKYIIDKQPSIDAVQVVRCGDCLFCQMELCEGADEPWCDIHHTTVDTEAFCSWGERKDND